MKRPIAAAGALTLALVLGACSSETTSSPSSPGPMTPAASSPAATPASSPMATAEAGADIVDTAVAAGDFNTLAAALTAAGLVDTLKGPGPFTVFAPTDAAFAKLPAGTVEELLKEPEGQLSEILTYHVVAGEFPASEVVKLNGQKVKTVQGGELTVVVTGDTVELEDAAGGRVTVTQTDVEASNGVIHVIDGVLMPAA